MLLILASLSNLILLAFRILVFLIHHLLNFFNSLWRKI